MSNLLIIILVLFLSLFLLVTVAEKLGKPMEAADSRRYSKIIVILMGLLLLAGVFKSFM